MSQKNVELVRRWRQVIEEAEPTTWATMVDAIFAQGAEWIEDPRWPGSTTFKGHDAINARIREYSEVFGWRLIVEDILSAQADVVVLVKALGRGEASGIETEAEWAFLLTFAAGEIVRWEVFLERGDALKAAGLSG